MTDQIRELRSANLRFRRDCQTTVTRSRLPAPIKATLGLLLDHFGSASHYSLAWPSHRLLAERLGCSERTVEWHCKAILAAGLLEADKVGCKEAIRRLKEEYGHAMKGRYPHFLSFYRINKTHPFWTGQEGATEQVVATLRAVVSGRDKNRTRPGSNPVAGDGLNPVAGDTANPVAGFGRAVPEEETVGTASSEPPYPLFERAHREKPGAALRAGRGDDSPGTVVISELVHNEEVSRRVANVEAELLALTRFNHDTALDPNSVASRVGKLWKDWKDALGRYPEDWMVADTINSKLFEGIKALNWGTLTSTKRVNGSSFRERLFNGVVERFHRFQQCDGPASAPATAGPAPRPDGRNRCIGYDWRHDMEESLADLLRD